MQGYIERIIKTLDIELKYYKRGSTDGYYDPARHLIGIKVGLSHQRTIETLLHELGHALTRPKMPLAKGPTNEEYAALLFVLQVAGTFRSTVHDSLYYLRSLKWNTRPSPAERDYIVRVVQEAVREAHQAAGIAPVFALGQGS